MSWFKSDSKLVSEVESMKDELKNLRIAKRNASEELETLKFKKRLEQEEIVHLQKINEAKLKSEVEAEKIALQKKYQDDLTNFKKQQTEELLKLHAELHAKMESRFNTELGNLKEIYKALMERLPNVTLALTKKM